MSEEFTPDTVILVHGLWMTPRSWENWVPYLEARGYKVIVPPYPGFEIEVEALRENPDVIAGQRVPAIIGHHTAIIESLERPPVIIGHSFGGTITQLLLARGLGCAGVVIDSAPTEGVRVTPVSQARSLFPILRNPATRKRTAGFTAEEFHYAFTNTLTKAESDAVYERYYIPTAGHFVWEYGLFANFRPGHQETWVDYSQDRAPLLFIGGSEDHIMPPSVNQANAKKYEKSPALTQYHEFQGRSHWTCAEPGWEEVADTALSWAVVHAVANAGARSE